MIFDWFSLGKNEQKIEQLVLSFPLYLKIPQGEHSEKIFTSLEKLQRREKYSIRNGELELQS